MAPLLAPLDAIAITGGIASGKSTAARILKGLGARVVSADEIAREMFDLLNDDLAALVGQQPPITGAELRAAMVADSGLRRQVNRLMHPSIVSVLPALEVDFIEMPLLLEACLQGYFREVWVTDCSVETQRTRMRQRYGDEVGDDFLNDQVSRNLRLTFADLVLDTEAPMADFEKILEKHSKRVGISLVE